jgi:hypothetical protein
MFEPIRNVIAAEVDMLKQGIGDSEIVQCRSTDRPGCHSNPVGKGRPP